MTPEFTEAAYGFCVGVALARPPAIHHEYRRIVVAAPGISPEARTEAQLTALQMASCTSVMPVSCECTGWWGMWAE